ncbi:ATP/GTP-binding protein [Hydrogenimonas cancrithermarum]|uniref:ATP-binding protein n=1 Tax=Hydrogenimonas cancrithermarum TaxID=2993563 RepID=A0ABN6WUG6_9BACT|nr:ATP/GTP-binding protein [Hydrogenimonas cancrithermarum]BDY11782.1 ATP-binding protein [Hydrogenimonas cancrithermarum]
MIRIDTLNASSNGFGFDLTTSSGDRISLSMYDNKSVSLHASDGKGERSFSMSLRHEYGYRFSYKGDGIDAQDRKEIEEAMKIIKPMFQQFLENVEKSDEIPGFKEITNFSQMMRQELPATDTPDMQNMLKDETVGTMDDVLALFEQNEKLLESTKRLFDRLFEQIDGFDFYV